MKARAKGKRPERWSPFEDATVREPLPRGMRVVKNRIYTVFITDIPSDTGAAPMTHLSIKRNDKMPVHDWRDLQRIKNELCGPEREALEIYPAESRLVDTANQYHLWVLPAGMRAPFGFDERLVSGESGTSGSRQRPFDEDPPDALSGAELDRRVAEQLAADTAEREGR